MLHQPEFYTELVVMKAAKAEAVRIFMGHNKYLVPPSKPEIMKTFSRSSDSDGGVGGASRGGGAMGECSATLGGVEE
jgi:hypothetical protein